MGLGAGGAPVQFLEGAIGYLIREGRSPEVDGYGQNLDDELLNLDDELIRLDDELVSL